jgi:transmembrane sensor
MDHPAFKTLLNKYLEGKCTAEEHRLVQQWYELLDDETQDPSHPIFSHALEERIWQNILLHKDSTAFPAISRRKIIQLRPLRWAAAAIIILLAAAFGYTFLKVRQDESYVQKDIDQGWIRKTNNSGKTTTVVLEDGSTVALTPSTTILYPRHFAPASRRVFLQGEAFFEVTKHPTKSFFVYNKNLVTEVLGTSFNISIRNNKIEVQVKTGRVAVYENGKRIKLNGENEKGNGVIITPNQKAIYDTASRHLVTAIVEHPVPIKIADSIEPVSFRYDETPLSEVVKNIENTYGIKIELENPKMKLCPFSGDISQQDLYKKLQLVCQAFNAGFETRGVVIYIKGGRDCN